jgi:osmoprotectant transport system ATP-binding protein
MIEFQAVGKDYQGGHVALRDLTLQVEEAQTLALLGPSGCGKTTTLRLVNRLVTPTVGRVLVGGRDVQTVDPVVLRRGIGYVVQEGGLFPHLTARANAEAVPKLLGWPPERRLARSRQLFELVGLEFDRFADRFPAEMSGGQRQRVGLARALAADPPILLMDEPFAALDPLTRRRLQDEFLRLQKELQKTVVFVTHDVEEAFRLADRIAVLDRGSLVQTGAPDEIRSQPASEWVAAFLQ